MPEDLPVVENIKLTEKKIQQQEPSKPIQ